MTTPVTTSTGVDPNKSLSGRFAGSYLTEAALKAETADQRTQGIVAVTMDGPKLWYFDADSSTGAGATCLVPDDSPTTGRWKQIGISADDAQVLAHLASTSNGEGASLVGVEDAGGFTATATVEAALAEIYQDLKSVQAQVRIPLASWRLASDGSSIPAFSNGVADGFSLVNAKAFGLRINDDSTTVFTTSVDMPQDLDDAADISVHALVSKTGATQADATKLTFGAFFQTVGAAHDADSDRGGDTGALVGDATAKTITELTRTILAAAVPAAPCGLTLTMVVKDTTLATDDLVIHDTWIEYKRKLRTS